MNETVEPTTYNLLFICTGNTCRSPMAEVITRAAIERRGWQHVAVSSAGTAAADGAPASPHACTVAAERGLDLSAHRAQSVSPELIDWADLILAMGPAHLAAIAELGGAERAAMATDALDPDEAGTAIEDPFGGDVDSYQLACDQLERAVDALLARLEPILAP